MIAKLTQKLLDLWQRFSGREKRLAVITAVAIVLMIVVTAYQHAMARIDALNTTIMQLEDSLISQTSQIAHRELVESKYAKIAAQHSSEWSEAEIHDRLRQEVYRLARKTPPPLDENGIPVSVPNEEGNLVEIPSLGKGNMAEGGEGYREYRINLRIPPCPLENLVHFLERLQQSPQSLRVDALELNRAPDGDVVSASIDITRIVANVAATPPGAPESVGSGAASSGTGRIALQAKGWQATGASVQDATTPGALEIRAENDSAEACMLHSLPGGSVYEMVVDMAAAQGEVSLSIGLESAEKPFEGTEKITSDGNMYRLHIQFTVPGEPESPVRIKCPLITIQGTDTVVLISNIMLRKVAEV